MQVEDEEENMGDVDLWALANNGAALTVDSRWLAHLQDRLLGEDGHPRKVRVYVCRGGGGGEGGRVPAQDVYVGRGGGRKREGACARCVCVLVGGEGERGRVGGVGVGVGVVARLWVWGCVGVSGYGCK